MKTNRKTQIIQTAAKLFREKGYNAISMRDLAENLNIKASSLYNHISSKQEILAIIVMDVAESFTKHMTETVPEGISSTKKLEKIIQMHVDITIEKTDFLACMNTDWMNMEAKNLNAYIEMRDGYEQHFREIIIEGMKSGELQRRNPEIVLFSLLSTLRTLYLWYSKNKKFNKTILKNDIQQNLLKGITK